jgi:predicted Zn-dependent peptidase
LSARTGKMYLDMVTKNEHATSINARASNSEYDGQFSLQATAREVRNEVVVPLDQIEKELWSYLEDAKATPCDDQLLQRVKNQMEAGYLRSLAGTNVATQLASMEVAYKWQFLDEQFKQRMAVTAADLMRVAKRYFTRDNSVTGVLERQK